MPAILIPSQAPLAKACSAFVARCSSSSGTTHRPEVIVSSVSGYLILDTARDAGMDMMQEDTIACAFRPRLMYATRTEPAMVANPEVMT